MVGERQKTVLFALNNPEALSTYLAWSKRLGHAAVVAGSREDLYIRAREFPDVVIMDGNFPNSRSTDITPAAETFQIVYGEWAAGKCVFNAITGMEETRKRLEYNLIPSRQKDDPFTPRQLFEESGYVPKE